MLSAAKNDLAMHRELALLRTIALAVKEEEDALRAWNEEADKLRRDALMNRAHVASHRVTVALDKWMEAMGV